MKHIEPSAAMSIPSAAHYLAVSRSGIYRLINNGSLPRLKIGGRSLIRRADADALLESVAPQALPSSVQPRSATSNQQEDIFG